ncbi:MAG: hypothetical protein A2X49_00765 [Lentisphaerae bacterium GWF2_52_8]|nr:MAG: hypothetical protein A2X49_00765 [Lentisphaerae bacterium GWF2_52_8]
MKRLLVLLSAFALITCLAVASNTVNAQEQAAHFYFVQFSDTHLGDGRHLERSAKIIDAINALPMKIEFVALTGDVFADNITDKVVADSAKELLKKIKPPLHLLPGNHDILEKDQERTAQQWMSICGELSSKAEYSGVVCLFLYTEPLRKKISIPGYEPLDWLEKKLKEANGKPVLLFHHAPGVEDFYENKLHPSTWKKEQLLRWIEILNANNVKAVFSGHFHRDEFHWQGNVPLFVSSSVAAYWGRQASFRIYEYNDGKISYSTQYIELGN